ncbi:MAG: hydrogenase maturation nickel metallochaperone HypA [Mariprofundus sp.]|nr:hydrogenase maturation nickel metallochaperone HypA [Mariprofundus sp.]
MHEMSLCEGVLNVLEDSARGQGFKKVKTVWLEIGVLAGVEHEAMLFSYEVVVRGSIAEGSKLEIIELPAQAWCMMCMKEVEVKVRAEPCPACGSYQLQISSGDELRIKELEVE